MRNLLAILFRRPVAPEKAESAHAPKQADGFAKVLQASLGGPNRSSFSGLATDSPASPVPETKSGPMLLSDAGQDGQTENLLASQPIASPRYDRGKSEVQVGRKAATPDGSDAGPSSRAGDKASQRQHTHRGYTPNPSRHTTHGDPVGTRSEQAQPKPDAAPAGQSSENPSSRSARTTSDLRSEPSARSAIVERVPTSPHATSPTPPALAAAAVNQPSGETDMPPNTSALVNTHASADVPSPRPGDQVRPQAWRLASEDQPELPIQQASIQTTQPEAPAQTPDLVTDGLVDLNATASKPANQANQGPSPLPQRPLSERAPVTKPLADGDQLVDSDAAPTLAPPVPASPKAAAPIDEPISASPRSTARPTMHAAEGQARLRTQADPVVMSADQNASTSARTGLTRPHPYTNAPLEMRAADRPALAARQHREAPRTRGEQPPMAASPVAVAPKIESPQRVSPQAPPSPPHTSLDPKAEASAKPFVVAASPDARTVAARPNNQTTLTPAARQTKQTIAQDEALPAPPRPASRPSSNQKPAAATEPGRAPEATPSTPSAPDLLDLPMAKPTAKEITFITQAAIETPQPSDLPPGSEPVAIPLPAQAKATSTPAHPLATAHHPGTRVTTVIRPPTSENASHALLITPPLVESTNPSASASSSPLPAEVALPVTSVPSSPLRAEVALPSTSAPSAPLPAKGALPVTSVPSSPSPAKTALPVTSVPSSPLPTEVALPSTAVPSSPLPTEVALPNTAVPSSPLPTEVVLPSTAVPSSPLPTEVELPSTAVPSSPLPTEVELPSTATPSSPLLAEVALPSTAVPSSPLPTEVELPSTATPSSPLLAEVALPVTAAPSAPLPAIALAVDVERLAKSAAPSPAPAIIEDGQGESGHPVVPEPVRNEPTATLSTHPMPRSGVSASEIQGPERPALVEPVQRTPTSVPDPVPAAQTRPIDTPSALPSHDTVPSAQPDTGDALPAQPPPASLAQSPVPAPFAGHAQIPSPPRSPDRSEHPVAPGLNHGEQVTPLAPQPRTEPTTLSAETEASTKPATGLPVVESVPSSGTAASDVPLPQPEADRAPRLTGHHSPRSPHPGSHLAQPEGPANLVEPNLPSSAPQLEAQPTPTAKTEEGAADEAAVSPAPAPTPLSTASQPLSPPVQSVVPPLAVTVPTSSEKPMPRRDAPAPAAPVGPVTTSQNVPGAPVSPVLATPVQAEDARTQRRPRSSEDEKRFSQAESTPALAAQSHQTRPLTAQAPRADAPDDQRNVAGNQNPSGHTSVQAAPALPAGNDRPVDLPGPQPLASSGPGDPSVTAPAQVSPPVVHAPPIDVRPPHLPNHIVPLAAQAIRDDGLSMTVMPRSAHMSIESSDGDLALHLRVRGGSADVTMGGSMAPLFEARAPEARAALASEGLTLGRFDLGQQSSGSGGQQGQPAPEHHERAPEPTTPYRHQSSHHEPAPGDGRIHVTA